jgi:uncharacterized protein involved in exopolysaccharide biosynthesis
MQFVDRRELADREVEQRRADGYPLGHSVIQSLREQTKNLEGLIAARVREIKAAEIERLSESDETLRRLIAEHATEAEAFRKVEPGLGRPGVPRQAEQRRLYDLDARIVDRFTELRGAR